MQDDLTESETLRMNFMVNNGYFTHNQSNCHMIYKSP